MEHSAYKEKLSALFDGELSGAEREAVLAHMDGCADCRAYFAELTALRAALGDWEEFDAPEGFAAVVMARLHAAPAPKTVKRRIPRRGYAALAACAAVILLAVYALPNALFLGGGNHASADRITNAAPAAAPAAQAADRDEPAPAPNLDYACAGGGDTGDTQKAHQAEESAEGGEKMPAAAITDRREMERATENAAYVTTDVTTGTDDGFPIPGENTAGENSDPLAPLARPGVYGESYPVLILSGEGAALWLAENGWQSESGAWYADAAALRALPDGLAISGEELPENYEGIVLVELEEAEP